ncbi:sugar ABC transporter permease [Sporosarcina saromensis]|uniref:Sugar ABC transporter permease n=1 Tax=Sporosarcina saromensis TaxID=359365 RepID=A0ABU4GDN2_9BACL|nr:DUF6677 family protein [Sporosarcina saromensis]MDW0115079.1 sugar ABC transporter permease [Sporosarcina saromensis]
MKKNTWLSAILSFVFPGLGHLYLGKVLKGIIFMVANVVALLLTSNILGILLFLIVWIYAILDSIKTTRLLNHEYKIA